jgi:hypothetical protein
MNLVELDRALRQLRLSGIRHRLGNAAPISADREDGTSESVSIPLTGNGRF